MKRALCLLLLIGTSYSSAPSTAFAQRGSFVEEMFRSIAEAQREREQRKRIEAEQAAREQAAAGSIAQPPRNPTNAPSDREVAVFARNLEEFNGIITSLTRELRGDTSRNPEVREVLASAYQLGADSRLILLQCRGLNSLRVIANSYAKLDAQWRQLSFRLRSIDGLPNSCSNAIQAADSLISRMSQQLQIRPQFDRHELHDLMIIASTYMQALIDDLQIARLSRKQIDELTHDCRVLRQQLINESANVETANYDELSSRFTDFVSRWSRFSEQVYAINDLHLTRRLDRISQTSDRAYALLWMPPPYNANQLAASAKRLHHQCDELLSQLSIRTLSPLPRQQQIRVMESSYAMLDGVKRFSELAEQRASRDERRRQFSEINAQWAYLRDVLHRLPAINQATLNSVDHECNFLRNALGVASGGSRPFDHHSLLEAAAALEGSSESLMIDLQRYERYLEPNSYRESIATASQEFHLFAERLHDALSQRADLQTLQRETQQMLDRWKQLSRDMAALERHGISQRRAQTLQRQRDELAPVVAKIAAALTQF
ncbi:MAG: hypothetical protein P8L85_14230 [Rubripirellula sp.]|nr:hypothetical protein [Rubripirellula sp.]